MSQHRSVLAVIVFGSMAGGLPGRVLEVPTYVETAVASVSRPPEDMARDGARKPDAMIAFAGVRLGDKVLELMPGDCYYTRILSKLVGSHGKVYAFAPSPPTRRPLTVPGGAAGAGGPPIANPVEAAYRLSRAVEFNNVMALRGGGPASGVGIPEQVDVVWSAGSYHEFHNKSFAPLDIAAVNMGLFRDLKPGGIYLIIDHAAAAGAGLSQTETMHRIDAEAVKKEVLAAGFVLDSESSVLGDDFALRFKKPITAVDGRRPPDTELRAYYGNTFVIGTPEQRQRTIFFHPDHSYQEFGMEGGITNGLWYLDSDGNACMVHQTEPSGSEGSVACRGVDFPIKNDPKLGDTRVGVDGRAVSLLKGYVYPNVPTQLPGGVRP